MSKYKKLVGNSLVFAIGNLGSKLISFVLVPLYTYYLTTKEYGEVDLITTTVSLLIPVLSGGISVAVLRFALDKENKKEMVVTNSLVVSLGGMGIALLLYPLLASFALFQQSLFYFVCLLSLQILSQTVAQFARGNGQVRVFAFNGMIKTLMIGLTNLVLLVYFKMGLSGYLISLIVAELISVLYLAITTPYFRSVRVKYVNGTFIKEMLFFSIPTIPNDVLWWFVNSSSRYFILYFIGVGANGIYAVANKIPSLISMMQAVFSQAWQISLVDEKDSETRAEFHEKIFKYYSFLLFITASGVLAVLKFILTYLVEASYYTSWQVTPFLLVSAIYSGFIGFYGQFYIAEKKTRGLMNTSLVSGTLSILLNYLFISGFGLIGVGLASMVSLFIGWLIRIYDTRKFVIVKIDWKNLAWNHLVIFFQIVLLFLFNNWLLLGMELLLFGLLLLINRSVLVEVKQALLSRKKKS